MVGYVVGDRIARLKHRANPLTFIRRKYPQFRPFRYDASYQSWMENLEQSEFLPPSDDLSNPFGDEPWFTIVIPMFNTAPRHLEALVESLLAQTFGSFEVVMVDASSDRVARSVIKRTCDADPRLRYHRLTTNEGISGNTNRAVELATGTFVVFVDHDDLLAPQALNEVAAYVREHPDTDILYSDEDKITDDGVWRHSPHFKPDWSPHQMLSCNYTSHLSVVRRDLLGNTHGLDARFDGAQDYELVLRLHTLPGRRVVGHIPKVLYHWRQAPGSTAGGQGAKPYAHLAGCEALISYLTTRGRDVTVPVGDVIDYNYEPRFAVEPDTEVVMVRVGLDDDVDGAPLLELTDTSDFASARTVDVCDASGLAEVIAGCADDDVVAVIRVPVVPRERSWLAALAGFAQGADVAAVSPRLLDSDGTVTDMGVIREARGQSRRLFAGLDESESTIFGPTTWGRDVAELTGDVVVSTAGKLAKPPARDQYNVIWPPVTMTVLEPADPSARPFNPNLIGLSNGRIAVRSEGR